MPKQLVVSKWFGFCSRLFFLGEEFNLERFVLLALTQAFWIFSALVYFYKQHWLGYISGAVVNNLY